MISTLQEKQGYKKTELGLIPEDWDIKKLSEVTDIRLSNVDKKSQEDEIPVRLCNYMDVYKNRYINDSFDFLEATAKENQIERFLLQKNDVIITKDSETQDDIGIPAVVAEELNNVLCGYHLALFRPDLRYIDGFYLMNAICSSKIKNYFAKQANGITRFGLTSGAINNTPIPLPPLSEQQKIAEVLGTVDEKTNHIDKQIEQAEQLKKGLMQELLTKGIGHTEFKDSEIGRIPLAWEVNSIGTLSDKIMGGGTPSRNIPEYFNGDIPWITVKDLSMSSFYKKDSIEYITKEAVKNSAAHLIPKQNIIISTRMGLGRGFINLIDMALNQDMKAIFLKKDKILNEYFLFWYLNNASFIEELGTGTTVKGISLETLKSLKIPLPNLNEQQKIAGILSIADEKLETLQNKKSEYENLKKGLMQKLLTGQIRVSVSKAQKQPELKVIQGGKDNNESAVITKEQIIQQVISYWNIHRKIDIKEIAKLNGILVYKDSIPPKGMSHYNQEKGTWEIVVQDLNDNYTVAHEIVHIIKHSSDVKLADVARKGENSLTKDKEREADAIASEIALPEECVEEYLQEEGVNDRTIRLEEKFVKQCAKRFSVSPLAMKFRLENLDYKVAFIK